MEFPCGRCRAPIPARGWRAVYCDSCEEAISRETRREVEAPSKSGEGFLRRVESALIEGEEEQNA